MIRTGLRVGAAFSRPFSFVGEIATPSARNDSD